MSFLIHLTIALASMTAIVLSCILFTNAIEFLGNKMKLGNNATGSILAVIGTGLPETIVPFVAMLNVLISNSKIETAQEIALGAVIGSPFMLSTLALFLLGMVLIKQKRSCLNSDYIIILRDYKYFLLAYLIAIIFSFNFLNNYKLIAVFLLISLYSFFAYRTIIKSRTTCIECECEGLIWEKFLNINKNTILFLQISISLLILILFSNVFINEIKYFSNLFNISPTLLTLIIAPFATELPEIINSLIWINQKKDDLAIANILGAIVFQATILFSIGIILTPWFFNKTIYLNYCLTAIFGLFFAIFTAKNKKVLTKFLLTCGIAYLFYLFYIILC